MKIIKFFYDLETTGVDLRKHSIHQIAGFIEVNGKKVEEVNLKTRPRPKAIIEPGAMRVGGVTEEQIKAYPDMKVVYKKLIAILGKYVERYDNQDRIYLVGFNNKSFDDVFFRAWFEQNGDSFFNSWFWQNSIDVMVLASQYLLDRRPAMPSFKLKRVAMTLGIEVDKDKLHEAGYDVYLTHQIYMIVTGLEIE